MTGTGVPREAFQKCVDRINARSPPAAISRPGPERTMLDCQNMSRRRQVDAARLGDGSVGSGKDGHGGPSGDKLPQTTAFPRRQMLQYDERVRQPGRQRLEQLLQGGDAAGRCTDCDDWCHRRHVVNKPIRFSHDRLLRYGACSRVERGASYRENYCSGQCRLSRLSRTRWRIVTGSGEVIEKWIDAGGKERQTSYQAVQRRRHERDYRRGGSRTRAQRIASGPNNHFGVRFAPARSRWICASTTR